MILGIVLLVVIVIMYQLFIKGWLFKIPLFFAGGFGICYLLGKYFPETDGVAFTLSNGMTFSYAACIAALICIMALATTKDD